ncbi:alanine--tRNA ligase [Candidatus Uhrbacteria bacterium]|nr:alanine--tRNA ligase [Candidatus Uhrbacteria bacterium]
MTSPEIRKRFIEFFRAHDHAIVQSSSLIPEDPSVLLTTAGMQQFKKYYTGEADPLRDFGSKSTASIQKSFRTSDIDEVGDESHLTFFEMAGNFSFGGYFKKEAITYAHDFITKEMGMPISYISIFKGSLTVPKDEESRQIWESLGVSDIREEGMDDVFWGPTGTSGPCGPTTEIYANTPLRLAQGKPPLEVWNVVFNQFFCTGSREQLMSGQAELKKLDIAGIDTGMGLERLAMISQGTETLYETDLFSKAGSLIQSSCDTRTKRIVLDHSRAIVFLLCDGVRPSNKERGYVLRRLMRRVIVFAHRAGEAAIPVEDLLNAYVEEYRGWYPELSREIVLSEWKNEKEKFSKTVHAGIVALARLESVDSASAFRLYESFGLPYEIIKEVGGEKARGLSREGFDVEFKKHQEISRAGVEKKFGGHGLLLDTGELKAKDEEELKIVTRLHTATHLLQQALRTVLGSEVAQKGSDITAQRTRFDFSFGRKLTSEELLAVENMVNTVIQKDLPMQKIELPIEEAKKTGALFFFREKYPEKVSVYYAGSTLDEAFSKEFCGGPHVTHTGAIGGIKITKEEATGAGVRRIRAVLA